ncbi:MAG: 30S ribosomal protein S19e [Methanosphaera sp.]|uniref:30S ribosomal protein S19e n=1 Tax=Methanosphaera sp. TaxID=2666342 RepID=UPI0025F5CF15|nr:30S ribosomal protein S19e [Methanosphaera sp.]MCI5867870.1 30S ribosomal protein S19e [Methanosphaera sp.]MDD6534880.1 30S ribosomal protein S19e [Methanosphaera sp.]MDY3955340.1 30S ribosomal protein S19e [Methanosphaera sp.]
MTTAYDVPAESLITEVSKDLKENDKIIVPDWARFVKTGVHKERRPENPDWWFVRAATLLRRIYVDGPVGIMRLQTKYGGNKDRGTNPEKFKRGSGSIIRVALQQLEDAGYVAKTERGRVVTPEGQSYLDNKAAEIAKDIPELSKY